MKFMQVALGVILVAGSAVSLPAAAQFQEVELPPMAETGMELPGYSNPQTGEVFSSGMMNGSKFEIKMNINSGAMEIRVNNGPVAYHNLGMSFAAAGIPINYATPDAVFPGRRDTYLEVWPRGGERVDGPQYRCALVACDINRYIRGDSGTKYDGPLTWPDTQYPERVWQADYRDWQEWRNGQCEQWRNDYLDQYLNLPTEMAGCALPGRYGAPVCGGIIAKKFVEARRNTVTYGNCKSGYYGPGNWRKSRWPRAVVGSPSPY